MLNKIVFCFLLLITSNQFRAQITPAQNSLLHFTQVYFEEQMVPGATKYQLLISTDSLLNKFLPKTDSLFCNYPAFWLNQLRWGQHYFWKINAFNPQGKEISTGSVHKFSIMKLANRNFENIQLRVNKNLQGLHEGGYIAIDNTRCIFTREGNPVWAIPQIPGVVDDKCQTRNITLTQNNTLLIITDKCPVEMDFEGKLIWQGPSYIRHHNDSIYFHHDLKKDNDGNYWVLGNKSGYLKVLKKPEENVIKFEENVKWIDSSLYKKTETGCLIKLDKNNKVLWVWDAANYLKNEDLNFKLNPNGFPNLSTHMNAFSLNKSGNKAYVGFRDLSRIVKIDIKTGKVEMSYGEKYPSGEAKQGNQLFRYQHDANITNRGTLLLLNNNTLGEECASVLEINEKSVPENNVLIWKLKLDFDSLSKGRSRKGGNVTELNGGNLLVCAGELNRVFEITRKKELLWDAFVYQQTKTDSIWQPMPQYRASFITTLARPHFVAKLTNVEYKNHQARIVVTLYNSGNVSDSYTVRLNDNGHNVLKTIRTSSISPQSETVVEIVVPGLKQWPQAALLEIVSINDKRITKQLNF